MESNTHSTQPPSDHPDGHPDEVAALAAALDRLAAQDLDRLPDTVVAEQVLALRRLVDRLEGQWLKVLAAVDARGAAGAEDGVEVGSTAAWLRSRLRMGAGTAASSVRTARALFRGPLVETAAALTTGELPVAHASVLAAGIRELPDHLTVEAEPLLLEAARRLDPPGLRRAIEHLRLVADPDGADHTTDAAMTGGGSGWPRPGKAWSPSTGCWRPRPARPCWPPWSRWPARPTLATPAAAANGPPMPWPSWPVGPWKGAGCPRPVGSGLSWR
jgi:uncharacterized protein DUF222